MSEFINSKTYGIFQTPANRNIINEMESKGINFFKFEPFETEILENRAKLSFISNNLKDYDCIIFPDIFSVDYFLKILEKSETDLFELDGKIILALGEAISDRLRFSQIHSDLIPDSISTDEIMKSVINYFDLKLPETRFLMLKFAGFESNLKNELVKNGSKIDEIEIYKVQFQNEKQKTKLKALLMGGAIDSFIFTAPEDVFFLIQYLSPQIISSVLIEVQIFATNEITTLTISENNLNPLNFTIK